MIQFSFTDSIVEWIAQDFSWCHLRLMISAQGFGCMKERNWIMYSILFLCMCVCIEIYGLGEYSFEETREQGKLDNRFKLRQLVLHKGSA